MIAEAGEIGPHDAANLLRIGQPTLWRLVARGHLTARWQHGEAVFQRDSVLAWRDRSAAARATALDSLAALSEAHGL